MQQYSVRYTILFSTAVCVICSLLVSASTVLLADRQSRNVILDRQKNVLKTVGLIGPRESVGRERVQELFDKNINAVVVELATGNETDISPLTFDQQAAAKDPATSIPAPVNDAGVRRLPKHALVYKVVGNGRLDQVILPIEGKGLWSTLYGYLALKSDGNTIGGITFYQHGETPGLGGEIENPMWQALWNGRKAFGPQGRPKIEVIKGRARSAAEDPYRVDGLSGATITSRGVSHFVQFWLGEYGFGPYLEKLRQRGELKNG
ncbi:MAG TPA: Na(+)-translocating NADH-quinone reductase subunit C [Phycisphaerae bacterium]|nr:Na(+)-translocating NADH-quinone reductase subunit C [Phycisphaerae bacterium]